MSEKDFSPLPRQRGGYGEIPSLELFDGAAYGSSTSEQWTSDIREGYGNNQNIDMAPDAIVPDLPISGPTILRDSFGAIRQARRGRQQEELPLE